MWPFSTMVLEPEPSPEASFISALAQCGNRECLTE